MNIVLDTNVVLISLPKLSPYRLIFDKLIVGDYDLYVTNEIISEYFEIIEKKTNLSVATNLIDLLLSLKNVKKIDTYYKWSLITQDYDDNKFVDCAITANANYIVTNDNHFGILKSIEFPRIEVINDKDFIRLLEQK